jgi:hypothetical protein
MNGGYMKTGTIGKKPYAFELVVAFAIGLAACFTPVHGAETKNGVGSRSQTSAQPAPAPTTGSSDEIPVAVEHAEVVTNTGAEATVATFGSRIHLTIKGLAERTAKDKDFPQKLILFLDGNAFKGIHPEPGSVKGSFADFVLPDKVEKKDLWKPLLKSPPLGGMRTVEVTLGSEDGKERYLPADSKNPPSLKILLFSGNWWFLLIGIAAVGLALCYLAATTAIIRDGTPKPIDPKKLQPYSLALTQTAWWFFLVFAAYVFIWAMTGTYNEVMTANALTLMGIGAGTSLGAAMVEATQSDQVDQRRKELEANLATATANNDAAQIATLQQLLRPASRDLARDLLTDKDGVTLHRFQMLVWTLALGVVFVIGVYQDLAMPEFDTKLLALMGISSGVYLGFKIPEKQA